MALIRRPAFAVGLVLLVLGVGNWSMGRGKVAEYGSSLATSVTTGTVTDFEEFRDLDPRTNAKLLQPLQQGSESYALIDAKLDFYKVVQSGGQLFTLLGAGLILVATVDAWRRTRGPAVTAARPH